MTDAENIIMHIPANFVEFKKKKTNYTMQQTEHRHHPSD